MEGLISYCSCVFLLIVSVLGERIEMPAFEYLRTFNRPLILGQCPNRLVSYPEGSVMERCTFPNRHGESTYRRKTVDSKINVVIKDVSELFKRIGLCDEKSVAYFGLLATKGDCLASEIAKQLAFTPKHVTRIHMEHYRPGMNILEPSVDLNIPSSYTLYLANTYYTDHIGIGTDEAILVDMQFARVHEAAKAGTHLMASHVMSHNLEYIAKHIAVPKKVKVIRLSTSDQLLQTKVFKGVTGMTDAIEYVKKCERDITMIRHELKSGRRNSHLTYGFKTYEIGPIALPLSSLSQNEARQIIENKRQAWENVTILQVEANRIYSTNRRYRKFCRCMKEQHKFCPLIKYSLGEIKRIITKLHTQRRDWLQLSYDQQLAFERNGRQRVKSVKKKLKVSTKPLKRIMKKATMKC